MRIQLAFIAVLLLGGTFHAPMAQQHPAVSLWERDSALAAADAVNIDSAIDGISNLKDLQALGNRDDWPLPAREAAIYKYAQSLASRQREEVSFAIIQYLSTYQAQVLVPNEDHASAVTPLFNIRGAASGVVNGWIRSESTSEAQILLQTAPKLLPESYLTSTDPSQRSGYLDAVRHADLASVHAVQQAALDQLAASPELTPLVAVTAAITADPDATRQLLLHGSGAGLPATLDILGAQYSVTESSALLRFAIEQAPAVNASLAIAAWWPVLRHDTASRQLLIDNLANPDLGSSAALALAQNPDIQTIRELQSIASGDSVAARRAQLALTINRDALVGEIRQ